MNNTADKQKIFVLFCLVLAIASFLIITKIWNADSYYTRPIQAISVKKSADSEEKPSKQPQAPGFHESEMKKYKGNRYSVYQ